MQQLHRIKTLLLVGREERPNLRVELLDNNLRFGPRLLMNRLQLRSHGSHERLDLALLRIGQLEHVRQHGGHVLPPFVAEWRCIVGRLRPGELCHGEKSREAECDWNEFHFFHFLPFISYAAAELLLQNSQTLPVSAGYIFSCNLWSPAVSLTVMWTRRATAHAR